MYLFQEILNTMRKYRVYGFFLVFCFSVCMLFSGHSALAQSKSASVTINKVEEGKTALPPASGTEGGAPGDADAFGDYQEPAPTSLPNPVFAFIRSLGSLVFILALVYLSIYGLKMFMSKKPGFAFASNIKVVESVFLSQNKSLHLVEVGGEMLLLGVTEGGMNVLKEIKDPSAINALRVKMGAPAKKSPPTLRQAASRSSSQQTASSFKDIFKSAAENFKTQDMKISDALPQDAPAPHEEKIRNSLNILRKELEKIQEIKKKEIS